MQRAKSKVYCIIKGACFLAENTEHRVLWSTSQPEAHVCHAPLTLDMISRCYSTENARGRRKFESVAQLDLRRLRSISRPQVQHKPQSHAQRDHHNIIPPCDMTSVDENSSYIFSILLSVIFVNNENSLLY